MDTTTCHRAPTGGKISRVGLGLGALAALVMTACAPQEEAEFTDGEPASADGETADDADNADETDQSQPEDEADDSEEVPEDTDEQGNNADNGNDDQGTGQEENAGDDSEVSGDDDLGDQDADDGGDGDSTGSADEEGTGDLDDAQQTVTYSLPDGGDAEMTMGLQSLKAGEEGLALTVSFVPDYDADEPGTLPQLHGQDSLGDNYVLPTLRDRDNLKMYYVPTADSAARDTGWATAGAGAMATEVDDVPIPSGQEFTLEANFPLPEDAIDTVDVAVIPGAPDFQDVEIDWGDATPENSDSDDPADVE